MSCRSLVPRTPWRRLPAGCLVKQLERVEASVVELKRNLDYAASVLEALCIEEARRLVDPEDQLGDIRSDSVPSEVRDWLASTFTRQTAVMLRRNEDKPRFRSIVHAVQAGIFVESMWTCGLLMCLH
uniref:calcium/calmodulin-dependent 3',5'-cyclic nucleotide phosphodiesterase 1C-like isoform X2 n=1 Tax=Gasterosteus aculeatus aculeatus TaxID=481459 RepID=UPI001A98C2DA|nr:calcium/calmodulin-dependent 3',5'-cyclic nucleotide phosphodiesterase 1C-like isoform X2 [Gasterosteus aculeatus aculeatus]